MKHGGAFVHVRNCPAGEEGRVSVIGTHEELMRTDNWYAQAFRKQHRAALNGVVSAAEG